MFARIQWDAKGDVLDLCAASTIAKFIGKIINGATIRVVPSSNDSVYLWADEIVALALKVNIDVNSFPFASPRFEATDKMTFTNMAKEHGIVYFEFGWTYIRGKIDKREGVPHESIKEFLL